MRLAVLCAVLGLALAAWGTDTAFWHAYRADDKTYGLFHFDTPALTAAEGKCKAGEVVGDAVVAPEGKFGGAVRFAGNGAMKFTPAEPFTSGFLSMEAWVKLDRYPDKEAAVIFRAPVTGNPSKYDPAVDKTFGFALLIDSTGALHMQVTNTYYDRPIRTSSEAGAVPLNTWVHVAAVSADFPFAHRYLFVNGKMLVDKPIEWGQGLMGGETEPGPIFIGNNAKGDAGLTGLVDEVRIHRNVFKFWPPVDLAWTKTAAERAIPLGSPVFWPEHAPVAYLPFEGNTTAVKSTVTGLKIAGEKAVFTDGVRGQGVTGPVVISAPQLLSRGEGTLEYWMQPGKMNNHSDFNYGFIGSNAFTLYILNSGVPQGGPIPFTLYFYKPDRRLHFLHDSLGTEFHAGEWYHIAVTWKGSDITLFINGKQAGQTVNEPLPDDLKQLNLNQYGQDTVFDEIFLYDKALSADEIANACYRYRDPAKVKPARFIPVKLSAWYLPSLNTMYYRLAPNIAPEAVGKLRLVLTGEGTRQLVSRDIPFTTGEASFTVPALKDGQYRLALWMTGADGKRVESDAFTFTRTIFPWEKSMLGSTGDVYPPYQPVTANGKKVSVILRSYEMNNFGLWNKVATKDRDILAGPMRVVFRTAAGEGKWLNGRCTMEANAPDAAVFSAEATADPVVIRTTSTVECDGCMKVEMELAPGKAPAEIERLWLDIPLKNREAPLYHTVVDSLRINPSGLLPAGEGVIWDGAKAPRTRKWQNNFVSYLWVGAEERGLAWFGENDRGWLTAKDPAIPTHELIRAGDTLTLRVYLVNTPSTITKPTRLVFGLQASPTKPMPPDWRLKLPEYTSGLAVAPWGGLSCSYMGPYNDDWRIVDKILETRYGKKFDTDWFTKYDQEQHPPLVHGNWSWLSSVQHFAGTISGKSGKPVVTYAEEMGPSTSKPAWGIFHSEWSADIQPENTLNFCRSYQDFALYYSNEWFKRGVGLYWDNTYPKVGTNPRTTAAYVTETGAVQPCTIIWNQRDYMKRTWNLMSVWRTQQSEPLEWHVHMTNTLMLPLMTWATVDLDHELTSPTPFTPAWLRTETMGRQVGNAPESLYAVYGSSNEIVNKLPEAQRLRIDWGMRMVHEIQRGPLYISTVAELDKRVFDIGYGKPEVTIHNYWEETPALTANNDQVKWILLARPAQQDILLVLASWSPEAVTADVTLDPKNLAFTPAGTAVDAETGEALPAKSPSSWSVSLPGPYGVRIIRIGK